ncbi:hypothetical protein KIW84_050608 [Lathyrus oleraceus]|uniref:CCHC-type domain-containing protein n=1 Tax=Pisum sativum TaxID=3888 RepID=A0A9D4WKC0_PEA|nr:hypothetical protein KIW84_050608 [Pisum sativum]
MEQLLQLNIKKANYVNYKSQRGRGRGQDRGCGRGHKGEGRWGYNNYSNKFNSGQRSWNPQATRDRGIGNSWLRCDKSQIKCFKCNKIGHYASECKYSKNLVEKANFVEEKGGEEETLMLACQNQVEEKRNKLYLDIDVSNHMCGDQSMFIEINEVTTKNVSLEMTQRYRLKEKEEFCWDWSVQEDMYDFLPYFEEEDGMEQPMIEEHITPTASLKPRLDETSSSERTP